MVSFEKSKKIPNGKLLQIKLEVTPALDNRPSLILRLQVMGDFFLYPEDGISFLEKSVEGLPVLISVESLTNHLDFARRSHSLQIIGFSPFDLATLIREALDESH